MAGRVYLLLFAAPLWAQTQLPAPQALYETSFEVGDGLPEGWVLKYGPPAGVDWGEGHAHTGSRAVHIIDQSQEDSVGLRGPTSAVSPGQRVWATVWYRTDHATPASVYLEYWDANGKRMGDSTKSFAVKVASKWTQTRISHLVPQGATHLTPLLYSWSTGTCDGYFDDLALGTGFVPTHDRTPRPPASVKHPCGPYSEDDIRRARANVARHQWAKQLLEGFKRNARFWMDIPDDQLEHWIPVLTPFRVVDCPNCQAKWAYCWSHLGDGRIKCRKCGTVYPNPEYAEADSEELLAPTGRVIPHPFYTSAEGNKHRLSGRMRYSRIGNLSKLGDMGRYYALTGDKTYAEKAVKVMRRLAQVYPDWVPHDWTRIYERFDNTQSGKMSGWKLHDCTTMLEVCLCYDLIYDSGALSEADKVAIENSVFRELGQMLLPIPQKGCCINDGPFQMSAAAYLGVLLGDHELIRWAVEPPGGFKGFLRDYFFRDGHWEDGSPSYEAMALSKLYLLPEILQGYSDPPQYAGPDRYDNLDVLSDALLKKIHIAPLYNMLPDRKLPPINDGAKNTGYASRHAEVNYFWYPTERNLALLNWVVGGRIDQTGNEYSLFRRDPDMDLGRAEQLCLSDASIVRPGLGWAILRQGERQHRTDLVLDYGEPCAWHGHPDRLNFILFAKGREVVTDLGYLGARHPFRPWMAHGVCHNLVMVDGGDQQREAGRLVVFQPGDAVQAVVARAPDTYPQCSRYERAMLMVTAAPGVQYVADVFRVAGGKQHDLSFHGDGARFSCEQLGAANPYEGRVGPEEGGYDWLQDVRSAPVSGQVVADWRFGSQDPAAPATGVRLRTLNAHGELINAKGPNLRSQSRPYDKPMLDYVILRRPGPLNTFASIVEPLKGEAVIRSARLVPTGQTPPADADGFSTVAFRVEHPAGVDYVVVAPNAQTTSELEADGHTIVLRGRLGVVSLDLEQRVQTLWLADGDSLRCDAAAVDTDGAFSSSIVAFDQAAFTFTVDCPLPEGKALAGQPLISDGRMDGVYTISRVEPVASGSVVHLAREPIMRVQVGEAFRVPTHACVSRKALGPRTDGRLYDARFSTSGRLTTPAAGDRAFLRLTAGPWAVAPAKQEGDRLVVALDAAALQGETARVLLSPRPIDLDEVAPPAVRIISPTAEAMGEAGYELGYVSSKEPLVITLADTVRLGPVRACAIGARTGPHNLPVVREELRACPAIVRCTIPTADLPDDDYVLHVDAADQLGNDTSIRASFQTLGDVRKFTRLPVIADTGKLSKPLGGLDTQFYRATGVGDWVTYGLDVPQDADYGVTVVFTKADCYGTWQLYIDDVAIGPPVDGYAASVQPGGGHKALGHVKLARGIHKIRIEVLGKDQRSDGYFIGLRELLLRPL